MSSGEKKPEEKRPQQQRHPPHPPPPLPSQAYPQVKPIQPIPPQPIQPPPPPPYRRDLRKVEGGFTSGIGRFIMMIGIPLSIGIIAFIVAAITLMPTPNEVLAPYVSMTLLGALILTAIALLVNFIAVFLLTNSIDKKLEQLSRSLRHTTAYYAQPIRLGPEHQRES